MLTMSDSAEKNNTATEVASPGVMSGEVSHCSGAQLLDELRELITSYVVLPNPETADAIALWAAATHCLPALEYATRLVIKSPEKQCGKTRLVEVLTGLCYSPLVSSNSSTAALYRSPELANEHPPTVFLDEMDAKFGTRIKAEQNEDLRAFVNAGFERNSPVRRVVGQRMDKAADFPSFAMVALAGIGSLPDTIESRSVIVTMRRRRPGLETVRPYKIRRDKPILNEMRERLADWSDSVLPELMDAEPDMPLEDRAGDVWEPLIAVADAAGGQWPARARAAALALTELARISTETVGVRLLRDIRTIVAASETDFIGTRHLLTALRDITESPWAEENYTERKLADALKDYGISPSHNRTRSLRGYWLRDFEDAFARYLPPASNPSIRPDSGAGTAPRVIRLRLKKSPVQDGLDGLDGSQLHTS